MAQGEFTKSEAKATREAVDQMMVAIPEKKRHLFLGHFNDIMFFLDAAEEAAPVEVAK